MIRTSLNTLAFCLIGSASLAFEEFKGGCLAQAMDAYSVVHRRNTANASYSETMNWAGEDENRKMMVRMVYEDRKHYGDRAINEEAWRFHSEWQTRCKGREARE